MRGLNDAPETSRLVVSVALLAACLALGLWIWPPDEARPLERFFPGKFVEIFDVRMSWHSVGAFGLAALVALGLRFLLRSTRVGITMRAVVDDRGLTALNGARPDRSSMLAWSLGCSLAALAGVLLAPLQTLTHLPLTLLIVNAYAAALMGRLRSLPITFLGAALLGLLDSYAFTYLPEDGSLEPWVRALRPAIPALVLFVVLVALPSARLRTSAGMRRLAAPRAHLDRRAGAGGVRRRRGPGDGCRLLRRRRHQGRQGHRPRHHRPVAGAPGGVGRPDVPVPDELRRHRRHLRRQPRRRLEPRGHPGGHGRRGGQRGPRRAPGGPPLGHRAGAGDRRVRGDPRSLDLRHAGRRDLRHHDLHLQPHQRHGRAADLAVPRRAHAEGRSSCCCASSSPSCTCSSRPFAAVGSASGCSPCARAPPPAPPSASTPLPPGWRCSPSPRRSPPSGVRLYAGTLGSISPFNFDLFQSLPLLLVTVAGGVASTGGAIFAVVVLGGMPAIAARFAVARRDHRPAARAPWASPWAATPTASPPTCATGSCRSGARPGPARRRRRRRGGARGRLGQRRGVGLGRPRSSRSCCRSSSPGWPSGPVAASLAVDPLDGLEARRLTAADRAELDLALGLAEVPR